MTLVQLISCSRFSNIFVIILFIIHGSSSVILECDFQMKKSFWGNEYTCVATNLRTSLSDRKISEVKGTHLPGKTNADVKQFCVDKQNCPYLPLDVSKFFPNLEIFFFMRSNVQHWFNGDIDGLNELLIFDISRNPIEVLGPNFFDDHETIEKISFFDCNLKSIHPNALMPLKNLKEAHFKENVCISENDNLQIVFEEIRDNCWDKNNKFPTKDFEEANVCPKQSSFEQPCEQYSFITRHAGIIISILSIILIAALIVFVKIFRSRLSGNWNELKEALI